MKRLAIPLMFVAMPAMAFAQAPDPATPDAAVTLPDAAPATADVTPDATPVAIPATEPATDPATDPAAGAPAKPGATEGEPPPQTPAEALFTEKCASCHTIGKGDSNGPDLKGAHERRDADWLAQMIKTPSKMLGSDPIAVELLKKYKNLRMPDLGLDDEQVASMIELIKRCSVETCNLAGSFVPVTKAGPADVERGRQLFVGELPLVNGGPPCISCHTARGMEVSIAGGLLAKDLTHVFARLGDETLDAALKSPNFNLMKDIYAKNKVDKDEAFALRAFFSASNRATSGGDSISVLLVAAGGTVVCLFVLNLFWRRRLRGVRKPLVRSQGVAS